MADDDQSTGDVAYRAEWLRDEIRRHNALYYRDERPEIPDRQYDAMMSELMELEDKNPELLTSDSPTQRVGGEPIDAFESVTHSVAMLSIDNTYSEAELVEFDVRVGRGLGGRKFSYVTDPKIDGVAASLRYDSGELVLAATRGDGRRGDDITANARMIRSIPLKLGGSGCPEVLEVRGEIYWPRSSFSAYNAKRVSEGREAFANPRNGTAGTLKQLDPKVVAERGLAFLAHGLGQVSQPVAETAMDVMGWLKRWSLPVNPHMKRCRTLSDVMHRIHKWLEIRNDVDYETDGMVVSVDELDLREELGQTSKYPRWRIAYKYEAQRGETTLVSVEFQVGRLGTVTPVAHFEPIQLAGTTVSSASLHNFDQIERLDLRLGDRILVEKAGEIIPQVVQVLHESRKGSPTPITPIKLPEQCPACCGPVARDEGGVVLRCINPECPAQLRRRLVFFAARDQMDIDNMGPAVVDQLVSHGYVNHLADLYGLKSKKEELKKIAGFAELSVEKLLDAIDRSKTQRLSRVIGALGIQHVGATAAADLEKSFGSMDELAGADVDRIREALSETKREVSTFAKDLREFLDSDRGRADVEEAGIWAFVDVAVWVQNRKLKGIGPSRAKQLAAVYSTVAKLAGASLRELSAVFKQESESVIASSVHAFFSSEAGRQTINMLVDAGLTMVAPKGDKSDWHRFAGLTVVLTGTLKRMTRTAAKEAIETAGGKVVGSVSSETSLVVVGESTGSKKSKKADKARELDIEMIDEAEFAQRLGL